MGVALGIVITLLLSACSGPNSMGWGDATAIHKAAWNGDADGVRRSLARGQDPNAIAKIPYFDIKGGQKFGSSARTPLQLAIHNNHPEAIRALLEGGAAPDSRLVRSVVSECPNALALFLSLGARPDVADHDGYPMEAAAMGGDVESAKLLLAAGLDINTQYERQGTALHVAASCGELDMALWLIAQGAAIDAINKDGWTPLHTATNRREVDMARFLLDHGAPVDAMTEGGSTPLHIAAHNCDIDMSRLLLDHGADPTRRTLRGDRPVDLVARYLFTPRSPPDMVLPPKIAARRAELTALLNEAAAKWSPGAETPKP